MKTTLNVRQILDLGGFELLAKVLEFNNVEIPTTKNVVDLKTILPDDKMFTFDSTFNKPEIDYKNLQIFYFTVGRYEDTRYILVFAYNKEEALVKARKSCEENIEYGDLTEINIQKSFFENDGVEYL